MGKRTSFCNTFAPPHADLWAIPRWGYLLVGWLIRNYQGRQFQAMTTKKPNPERGTVIVEAAFTLLLLFTFLFGLMEVGRFISVQQALTHAAREGARARITRLSQTSYLTDRFVVRTVVCAFLHPASVSCNSTTSTYDGPADQR